MGVNVTMFAPSPRLAVPGPRRGTDRGAPPDRRPRAAVNGSAAITMLAVSFSMSALLDVEMRAGRRRRGRAGRAADRSTREANATILTTLFGVARDMQLLDVGA